MLREILFTHDDLDGVGCAVVYRVAMNKRIDGQDYIVVHCSNNNVNELVKETISREDVDHKTVILFTDIMCSPETLMLLDSYSVFLFDHHQTNAWAETALYGRATVIPKDKSGRLKCGTSLLFERMTKLAYEDPEQFEEDFCDPAIFHDEPESLISRFAFNVEEYDTFQFKESGNMQAKYLQVLFNMLGQERFIKRYVNRIMTDPHGPLISDNDMDFVQARVDAEQKYIDNLTEKSFRYFKWKGRTCAMILNPFANVGELAYQYLGKHPELDAIVAPCLNFGEPVFQFRGYKEDVNTGIEFAVPMGGGGHPKASGAPIGEELMASVVSSILNYITFKAGDETDLIVAAPGGDSYV